MQIISAGDNGNNTWKTKTTTTERSKGVTQELNELVMDYNNKLGFLQLICRASLIFKSNFELALSIFLKGRELYESKHVLVESRCLKIRDLLSFLIFFSIPVIK